MNTNEVVANLALEILRLPKGDDDVIHPLEDVNLSQSTNDAYPTALRVALHEVVGSLLGALGVLTTSFDQKATEFHDVLKMGRTQLPDAVPMRLGQELGSYSAMVDADMDRLREARALLTEVNLGETAMGTGINADARYGELVIEALRDLTGVDHVASIDLVAAS
jgi:aspartate ammonia-lyase